MTNDPNNKQNEGSSSSDQQYGQKPGQQSEQHDKTGQTQKRPSQPGNEADQNDNQKEQGGQRRAS
jgi:hypothetical protein